MTVIFHMTADSNREQRHWDKFPQLAEHLISTYNATILIVGSAKDRGYITEVMSGHGGINLAGQTNLNQLIQLLGRCDFLFCINSFVMHLGVALGVKMFAIVGATEPKVILPPGIPHAYSLYAKDIPLKAVLDWLEVYHKENRR